MLGVNVTAEGTEASNKAKMAQRSYLQQKKQPARRMQTDRRAIG